MGNDHGEIAVRIGGKGEAKVEAKRRFKLCFGDENHPIRFDVTVPTQGAEKGEGNFLFVNHLSVFIDFDAEKRHWEIALYQEAVELLLIEGEGFSVFSRLSI